MPASDNNRSTVFVITGVGTSTASRKTQADDSNKDKDEENEDNSSRLSPNRRNRYSSYGSSPTNYRGRIRRPSSYEDLNSNDWSTVDYRLGNPLLNYPGSLPPVSGPIDHSLYSNNEPTCYRLLDPQYPLFSDLCGAVPQARYSLPNSFGHFERWQITQVLNTMLGTSTPTSTNPTCARSLRLLICPLLFPPCPSRHEPPPVVPCQPFCRAVKSQCSAPSLDLLPCDFLPPTSDLCPVNPAPYSSLLSSYSQPLSLAGGAIPSTMPQSPLSAYLAQSALQLALSQPTYASQMSPSGVPQTAVPSVLPQSSVPAVGFPSMVPSAFINPTARTSLVAPFPFYQQFNTQRQMADTITPVLVNFPPLQYAAYNGQVPRFFPALRSGTTQAA
ncbi:unnamed protein product [Rotaria sp. Silwood1]|nr:unnamed protein product [Rotaria sp. Silwood1]CAF1212188.1 unnamed protein product [Rotaria sp. Silwood1]CAF4939071.1 unnamed protein product [Rotaria sp. Silwood1]